MQVFLHVWLVENHYREVFLRLKDHSTLENFLKTKALQDHLSSYSSFWTFRQLTRHLATKKMRQWDYFRKCNISVLYTKIWKLYRQNDRRNKNRKRTDPCDRKPTRHLGTQKMRQCDYFPMISTIFLLKNFTWISGNYADEATKNPR